MRQLRLSATKLAKDFTDTHRLETTVVCKCGHMDKSGIDSPSENSVERLAASGNLDDALSLLPKLMRSLEASPRRLYEASVRHIEAVSQCSVVPGIC